MLTFKLISVNSGFYHYEIYPEGCESNKGTIIFNPNTKEIKKKIIPKSPFNCISHFFNSVLDENGNYKERGMAVWF